MGSAKVALPTVERRVARRDDASGRRRRIVIGKCRESQRRFQFTRTNTCRLFAAMYGQALLARETTRNRYV